LSLRKVRPGFQSQAQEQVATAEQLGRRQKQEQTVVNFNRRLPPGYSEFRLRHSSCPVVVFNDVQLNGQSDYLKLNTTFLTGNAFAFICVRIYMDISLTLGTCSSGTSLPHKNLSRQRLHPTRAATLTEVVMAATIYPRLSVLQTLFSRFFVNCKTGILAVSSVGISAEVQSSALACVGPAMAN